MSKEKTKKKSRLSISEVLVAVVLTIGNIWYIAFGQEKFGFNFIFCAIVTFFAVSYASEACDYGRNASSGVRWGLNVIWVLSLYPIMKFVIFFVCQILTDVLKKGDIAQFLCQPAVETGIIAAIDLLLLWVRSPARKKKAVQRVAAERAAAWEKELANAERTTVGPDGNRYPLPTSYKDEEWHISLADEPEKVARYFHNEIHQLLWYSEMADMFYQAINWNQKISWANPSGVSGDYWFGLAPDYAYRKFCFFCIGAIDGWKKQGNLVKFVHYSNMLFQVSMFIASSGAWFYWESDRGLEVWTNSEKISQDYFEPLIKIYQEGAKDIRPDPDKAAEYQRQYEKFLKDTAASQARGDKLKQEFLRTWKKSQPIIPSDDYGLEDEVSTDAESSWPFASGGDFIADDSRGVNQLPEVMTDGARHRYVRSGGPGSYPAEYHCAETGDTVYIYRAVLHGGYADTDCGAFYY